MPKVGRFFDKIPNEDEDILERICWFKKHEGETWRQVLDEDPKYVLWILEETDLITNEQLRDELMFALEEIDL